MNTPLDWIRFWCPRDGEFSLTADGLLQDPESTYGPSLWPHICSTDALKETPCLVLLGEAGSGKSTEINRLGRSPQEGGGHRALAFDLGEYGSEDRLERKLFQAPEFLEWKAGTHLLHLELDALDEALLEQPKIIGLLREGLRGAPIDRLRLRIACRTGAWPEPFTGFLSDIFAPHTQLISDRAEPKGDDGQAPSFRVVELLPLREADVQLAVRSDGQDEEKFLDEVRRLGVGPLAANPTTLQLLLRLHKDGGSLPQGRVELYGRGLLALCERGPERTARNRTLSRSASQLLQFGGRVAALTMLTGRPSLFSGSSDQAEAGDVTENDIVSAGEADPEGEFEVTPEDIRLLRSETGLLTARGACRFGFAHKTYGEFLAARHLHRLQLPSAQLKSVLFARESAEPRLIPQLREVGAWLAAMDDVFCTQLLESEPEVLVLSDVATKDEVLKKRLVDGLLERVDQARLSYDQVRSLRPQLHRLRHAGLAEQVRAVVRKRNRTDATRELAVEIAETTREAAVAADLAALALDQTESHLLRKASARAVYLIGDESAMRMLVPLAMGTTGEDPDDGLRGIGLHATWPRIIPVESLFAALTPPKQHSTFGAYAMFLDDNKIWQQIAVGDLPIALAWAAALPSQATGIRDPLPELAGRLAWRAVEHLETPGVRSILCDLLTQRLRDDAPIVISPQDDQPSAEEHGPGLLGFSDELRRLLLEALIPRIVTQRDVLLRLRFSAGVLCKDDTTWLFERAADATGDESRAWAYLARWFWNPYATEDLELWLKYEPVCAAIAETMPFPRSVQLESDMADKMKREHLRNLRQRRLSEAHRQRARKSNGPPPAERVHLLLDRCLQGEPELFSDLTIAMLVPDSGESMGLPDSIEKHPGWERADEPTRRRMSEAARRFILEAPLDPSVLQSAWPQLIAERAPSLALDLLASERMGFLTTVPVARWASIGPYLLLRPLHSSKVFPTMCAAAYRSAPATMRDTAMRIVREAPQLSDIWPLKNALSETADAEFQAELLRHVRSVSCGDELFESLAQWLMETGAPGATEYLESHLTADKLQHDPLDKKTVSALALLLGYSLRESWPIVGRCLDDHSDTMEAALEHLVNDLDRRGEKLLSCVSDEQAFELAKWLLSHYSPATDRRLTGAYRPTPDDEIRRLRDGLLNLLSYRGTVRACGALRQLRDAFPDVAWLHDLVLSAEQARLRNSWSPPTPSELSRMLHDPHGRYVASGQQLLEVIIESLERFQKRLHGTPRAVANLWDGSGKQPRRPKDEEHLSDNLKLHLDYDLVEKGIVVNREVRIRPRLSADGEAGQELDLLVQAIRRGTGSGDSDTVSVTFESKGSWNAGVAADMEGQLVERYMKDNECRHGLYVVGWFHCPGWSDAADTRRRRKSWDSIEAARTALEEQAAKLTAQLEDGAAVRAVVLDCRLP